MRRGEAFAPHGGTQWLARWAVLRARVRAVVMTQTPFQLVRLLSSSPYAHVSEIRWGAPAAGEGARASGQRAVLKRLGLRVRADAQARETLAREGRILTRLAGRGAVTLLASGEDADGPYLVLAWEDGPLLEAHIESERRGAAEPTLERLAVACFGALDLVHGAHDDAGPLSVVHGDVSPSNVIVSPDGARARFLDFGQAQCRDEAPCAYGARTLRYAAPEVARGEPFDARADLFALGAALLHVASAEPPRAAPNDAALLLLAGEASIEPYARRASSALPRALADALVACVAADPRHRPESARAVLDALGKTA